jgi:hypothetical protein
MKSLLRNSIEVYPTLRSSNLYNFKQRNSLPVNRHILTSNRYAELINLQYLVVDVNDGTVSSGLGLLHDVQREDRQTVVITFLLYLLAKSIPKQLRNQRAVRSWEALH